MKIIEIRCQAADTLPIEDLQAFQGDLKKITRASLQKLKDRIVQEGFIAPIFVWMNPLGNYILDGHQRLRALESLRQEGYEIPKLPVAYIDADTEKEARRKLLSITTQYGDFVIDQLESWMREIDEDLRGSFRFANDEMKINIFDEPDETDQDDVVPTDVEEISKVGDIWQLGPHRLMCGDSTDKNHVAKLMHGNKADMIFTDPPYGVSYQGTNNPNGREWEIIAGDKLRGDDLYKLLFGAFQQLYAFSKENPAVYVWHASSTQMIFETALIDAGFEVKEQLIWNKGMVLGHSDYHWTHEPCFYVRKKGNNNTWYGDRKQRTILRQEKVDFTKMKKSELISILEVLQNETTVWEIRKDSAQTYIHPTQKPVDLCMRAIRNNTTLQQNLVLDLFSGSASTIIACEKSRRVGYAMELDPKYVDLGVQRYINWCEENGHERDPLKRRALGEIMEIDNLLDDFNIDFGNSNKQEDPEAAASEISSMPDQEEKRTRRATVLKRRANNTYRRAFSETQLLDVVDLDFQDGDSYHFITGGDVDALSYLKIILRQQDLDYLLFSTWCMASEDIYQFRDWIADGRIGKVDAYVGEIFPGSYRLEYGLLKDVIKSSGGRVAVFKNHSKIFAGIGPLFAFGIETSANINTNPRTENGCITIDENIYRFYRDYFDGIISYKEE